MRNQDPLDTVAVEGWMSMVRKIVAAKALGFLALVSVSTALAMPDENEPARTTVPIENTADIDWDLVVRAFDTERACRSASAAYRRPGNVPVCMPHETKTSGTLWLLLVYHL
ncbi:hypothetical protein ACWIGW_05775 [Nocardia brasiliensis]